MTILYVAYTLLLLGALVLIPVRIRLHRRTAREIRRLSEEWHTATDRLTQSVESLLASRLIPAQSRSQLPSPERVYGEDAIWPPAFILIDASCFLRVAVEYGTVEYGSEEPWWPSYLHGKGSTGDLRIPPRKLYSPVLPHRKYDYKVPALRTT